MRRLSLFILALASGALASAGVEARPQHHHRHHVVRQALYPTHEIVVKKRSFLDPGNVVPVGSENSYMLQSTIFHHTPPGTFRRAEFGDEVLPGAFDLPGFQRYAPW